MLNIDFIKTHGLEECLKAFEGAHGDETKLTEPFGLLARKLLYGGHFEVSSNGKLLRCVYLHTVEFYYHEEDDKVKDYIVYHRNKEGKDTYFPPFPVGSLNAHQSGIDITFEDWRNGDRPKYRASALIRAFKVKEGNATSFKTIVQPKKNLPPDIEFRSTYLYDYLFMGAPVSDLRIQWVLDALSDDNPVPGVRRNVPKFNEETHKKVPKSQDPRLWGYSRC